MQHKAARKHRPRAEKLTTEDNIPQKRAGYLSTMSMAVAACGFLLGILIICFHPFDEMLEHHIRSEMATFIDWYPATFQLMNRISGISLLAVTGAYLICTLYRQQAIDAMVTAHYRNLLVLLIGCLGVLSVLICFNKFFHIDEIEHVHSSWYIKNGYVPYRDFFQHHNPLFWFLLLPVLYLGGDSVNTILLARLWMWCVMSGIVYCVYLIAATASKSKETGLLSVLLTLSTTLFIEKCIEIRPDALQVLFGMISLYWLIRFTLSRNNTYLIYSGLTTGLSFLFLQKAIFLAAAYGVVFAYGLYKRDVGVKSGLFFCGGFLLPLLLFWAYLQMTGSLSDYFLTNWQLNWHHLGARGVSVKPSATMTYSLIPNLPFWTVSATSICYLLLKRCMCREMKIIVFVGLVQTCSLLLYATTFKHYYLFSICLLSVPGAYFLTHFFATSKIMPTHRVALLAMIIIWSLPFLLIDYLNSNHFQLGKMKYVLNKTKPAEIVYDGANNFNLFRHDMHYFWFQIGQLKKYNNLTNDRFGDYDCCSLIKAKRPKLVNEMHFDFNACGLGALYDTTKYPGVYIRREGSAESAL